PKSTSESPTLFQLLAGFWPRLAFAAALIAVLILVLRISAPVQAPPQQFAQDTKKSDERLAGRQTENKREEPADPAAASASGGTRLAREEAVKLYSRAQDKA